MGDWSQVISVDFFKAFLDSGVGLAALLVLLLAVIGFILNQRQNGKTLNVVAAMASAFKSQLDDTSKDLRVARHDLDEERAVRTDKLGEMLKLMSDNLSKMLQLQSEALGDQKQKIEHIIEATDRVNASAAQRLDLLKQVVSHQNAANTRIGELEGAVTKLVEVVTTIDGRTERNDAFVSALLPLPRTLEIVTLVLQGKLDEALAEQKRTTGQTLVVAADG